MTIVIWVAEGVAHIHTWVGGKRGRGTCTWQI